MNENTLLNFFGTPIITRGWRSLPFTEFVVWLVMARQARQTRPDRTLLQSLGVGLLSMVALLKWEWLHNLSHAAAARLAGKPMDSIEIISGMPLCNYSVENHRSATPRQHILRALGGPVFNFLAMLATRALRRSSPPDGLQHELLDVAVGMNSFLGLVSLLPIPGIDGGPILKWSLVASGRSPQQADHTLHQANLALAPLMGITAGFLFRRRRWFLGGLAVMFGLIGFAVGKGWIRGESRDT